MKRGKFIVIEGIDGAGKTTQVKLLQEKMLDLDIPVHITRECSDGPIGKIIRELYFTGKRYLDSKLLTMLYAADRYDHIINPEDGIISKLEAGINVISDRYYLSSFALHELLDEDMIDKTITRMFVSQMNEINSVTLSPDLTINISVSVENALKNLMTRNGSKTIMETKDRIYGAYRSYPRAIKFMKKVYGDDVITIDGNKSIEEVHNNVWNTVKPLVYNSK